MKVLVNAVSVKEGGPLVVLDKLLGEMRHQQPGVDWAIAAHPSVRLDWNQQPDFVQLDIGNIDSSPFGLLRWYEFSLPAAIERSRVDLVFSITNYLPLRRLTVPTVLLVQHAGHFSDRFDELTRRHLRRPDRIATWMMKTRWVERSVRMASEVTTQTKALADAIAVRTRRPREHIHAISHGPGTVTSRPVAQGNLKERPARIGYITKWGVQKNFGVLLDAAISLKDQGRDVRLIVTLAENLAENKQIIQWGNAAGLRDVIENAGEVDAVAIATLYDSLDIFVFPSLVESFGFPLVEAMAKGLPVVAADTPSNREIAGDAGLYFPPADADTLVGILGGLIDDPGLRKAMSTASLRRAQDFSWRRAAEETLTLFDAALK